MKSGEVYTVYGDRMFKALIEKSSDIILVTDRHFEIKYISSSVNRILGFQIEEVLFKNLFDFIQTEHRPSLMKYLQRRRNCPDTDYSFSEISLTSKTGEQLFFDVTLSNFLKNPDVNGLVFNLHDITDRKLTEEKLRKANNELDQFIYKTSHDLRAPLLSALGLVQLAEVDPQRDQYKYLDLIKSSLNRLDDFIEDINSFFRNEKLAIRNEKIDLEELIRLELRDMQTLYQSNNIDISFDIDAKTELFSDSIRLQTIITNILSNAIKYSDKGKSKSYIHISAIVDEEQCYIKIADNGIGIDSIYQDKIFDIFFRATELSKGSGLGLYIVKDTINKLGGRITLESTSGIGTTFNVYIPNFIRQKFSLNLN